MPYIWTEPALVIEHQGVSVYHVYRHDHMECGYCEYWYTTDITEQAEPFDIRNRDSYQNSEDHSVILKQAIERGEITMPVDN